MKYISFSYQQRKYIQLQPMLNEHYDFANKGFQKSKNEYDYGSGEPTNLFQRFRIINVTQLLIFVVVVGGGAVVMGNYNIPKWG